MVAKKLLENGHIALLVPEITITGNLRDIFSAILTVGAETYIYGANTISYGLINRMKVAER